MKKLIKQKLLEYLTQSELKSVEQNADNLFSDVNIDFDFTNHFIDRVNDPRNGKEIEPEELNNLFYKTHEKFGSYIKNMPLGDEKVIKDKQTAINIPIVSADKINDKKIIKAKTIMRKPNFVSSTPFIKV